MRAIPNWVLSVASVLVFLIGLVGAEDVLRLLNPHYLYDLYADESSNVYSETLGWELRRGFRGVDFGHLASVNASGYRGTEHPHDKPAGRTRIVMVGDSIAYGAGVDDAQTFSALVESHTPGVEVVNLAVGGYGTDQELIRLERDGLRYHPDVVVLHFCLFSDFTDNALPSALFDARQPKPYFTWDGGTLVKHDAHLALSLLRRLSQWLYDYSHLYNRLRVAAGLKHPPRQRGVWADRKGAVESHLQPAAELTFHLIQRAAALSRAAGARFFVVVHPDEFAFKHRSKLLRKFCSTPLLEGIPVIEMGARHRAAGLDFAQWALDEPGHLTERGHAVMAETLSALVSGTAPAEWDYRTTCRDEETTEPAR